MLNLYADDIVQNKLPVCYVDTSMALCDLPHYYYGIKNLSENFIMPNQFSISTLSLIHVCLNFAVCSLQCNFTAAKHKCNSDVLNCVDEAVRGHSSVT